MVYMCKLVMSRVGLVSLGCCREEYSNACSFWGLNFCTLIAGDLVGGFCVDVKADEGAQAFYLYRYVGFFLTGSGLLMIF